VACTCQCATTSTHCAVSQSSSRKITTTTHHRVAVGRRASGWSLSRSARRAQRCRRTRSVRRRRRRHHTYSHNTRTQHDACHHAAPTHQFRLHLPQRANDRRAAQWRVHRARASLRPHRRRLVEIVPVQQHITQARRWRACACMCELTKQQSRIQ
jgi:hypothetical protein